MKINLYILLILFIPFTSMAGPCFNGRRSKPKPKKVVEFIRKPYVVVIDKSGAIRVVRTQPFKTRKIKRLRFNSFTRLEGRVSTGRLKDRRIKRHLQ